MYQTTQLDNGLRVVTKSMAQRASVSVGIWVGVGSRFEPARLNGVCHFIEHMLFKGTLRRSPRQISQAVEGIGGYLNAFTSEDHTCYYSKARHDRLPELLNVLMDMLLNSTFPVGEIRKERSVIKEEILMYLDQPHQHVQELLNEVLWPDHPLGRNIVGTDHTLDRMSRRHLVDFLQNNYHAGNTVIAAAGSDEKLQTAKAHGADHLINYTTESIRDRVKAITNDNGLDVLFDPVGGDAFEQAFRAVNWQARLLIIGFAAGRIQQVPANHILVKNVSVIGVVWGAQAARDPAVVTAGLREMLAWWQDGKLKPHVAKTFPLADASAAMNALLSRAYPGKIVLTCD